MTAIISEFRSDGWAAEGKLFNNHLTAIGQGFTLRFLFTLQLLRRWFRVHPSIAVTFFDAPWAGCGDGKKLGVRFENVGPPVEALFDVRDRGEGKSSSLICHDPDVFEEILARFVIPKEVAVTVFGKDEEIARIPLPHDPHFVAKYELFKAGQ